MPFRRCLLMLLTTLVLPAGEAAALPLGHPDFLPTPQHPVGWRGDGSGVFPGATFRLTTWSETQNVIWKTAMASHSNSAPIVVGSKVFTLREPNYLVCVDAKNGEVLWERENDPLEIRGVDAKTVVMAKRLAELAKAARFLLLSERPDDRGGEASNLAQKEAFAKSDDRLLVLLQEAAGLDPVTADLHDQAVQLAAVRDSDFKRSIRGFKPLYDALGQAVAKHYNFFGANTWPGYIDHTYPTPASDGRRVYVAMGQNQVVCYDLDGKRVWAQSPGLSSEPDGKRPQSGDRATYTQSPLLVDGLLVVQAGFMIRAFDAASGKVRWELPYPPQGASYSCGTARAMRVDGESVLITVHGWVIRVADGKRLGDLKVGYMGSESGGSSLVGDADGAVYFLTQKGDISKLRLKAETGAVGAQTLWSVPIRFHGPTPIAHAGLLYVSNGRSVSIVEAENGQVLKEIQARSDKPSPIIAGDRLIIPSDKGIFTILSLGRDAKGLGTATMTWTKPPVPWLARQWPDTYAAIQQGGRKFDNTVSRQFTYSHPFAHGDRLYIRSVSHLYCIGSK